LPHTRCAVRTNLVLGRPPDPFFEGGSGSLRGGAGCTDAVVFSLLIYPAWVVTLLASYFGASDNGWRQTVSAAAAVILVGVQATNDHSSPIVPAALSYNYQLDSLYVPHSTGNSRVAIHSLESSSRCLPEAAHHYRSVPLGLRASRSCPATHRHRPKRQPQQLPSPALSTVQRSAFSSVQFSNKELYRHN